MGLTSYSADLAFGLSRSARDNYIQSRRGIREDVSAVGHWETIDGGMMWSAGVGGPITGRGADVVIIDDPLKNAEEAGSQLLRGKHKEWYRSTLYTRLEPNGAVIIVMTRWHMDDLAGWLLSEEQHQPEHWYIVNLPALKETKTIKIPRSCELHPDNRKPGEALCPERYDAKRLAKIKGRVGSRFWSAMFQQRPSVEEGEIWKRSHFKTFKPEQITDTEGNLSLQDIGVDWDLAYTKEDANSASAFIISGHDATGNIYVTDIGFDWKEFPALVKWMASKPFPHYVEAKAAGKSAVQTLTVNNISASEVQVQGGSDKIGRAKLASPAVENGRVFIAEHLLEMLFDDPRQGILRFPNGEHDDLNDAFVQALNRHGGGSFEILFAE